MPNSQGQLRAFEAMIELTKQFFYRKMTGSGRVRLNHK